MKTTLLLLAVLLALVFSFLFVEPSPIPCGVVRH